MSFNRVQYNRLYEQVLEQIENQIESGDLKLGDRLPTERELSNKIGVSRGTLREAFRILEEQGIIETKPGGGRYLRNIQTNAYTKMNNSIISELQKAAIIDLLEIREILELKMVELACERITKEEIDQLEKGLNENQENRSLDYDFHIELARASKNIVIVNFMKLNINIIKEARKMSFNNTTNFTSAIQEHREILDAVKNGDKNLAKEKLLMHLSKIRVRMNQEEVNLPQEF
ncbi:FadR family transcriptional regulator [Bacillus sp. ISL-47]|uniref:FadR/GntR family transcriptional regulator n=1 Tax=Bacillus sp. ISL-47 TaxID=2819130 RepID=UPI001BEAD6DF|nr:FadR/GntR family transcriptional regulator [Bacillus sp. ISL-47]MBT2689246.1 FadR family transcriptional regulator [Bacillus sp. ISL-47]MBT2708629.1 FadR family transcriptional regulator [Pseudomonas sp. ISL-84]